MEVVAVLFFIGIAVTAIWWSYHAKKKRRELMARIAEQRGARYLAKDPWGLSSVHERRFSTLRTGSRRYAYNVVHGDWETKPFWLFDHHYETYSHDKNGRKTHHHYRTFLLLETNLDLGGLEVRPEGFFDKVKSAFGFDDIDFESAEFSRKWFVSAEDREFAFQVFHARMIEHFLTLGDLRMATAGPYVLLRVGRNLMNEEEMNRTFVHARDFLERLPRFVRKDRALGGER
ncbi:MAG: hypothetical protein AAGD14_11970 [Planctomycetota bacterium]